MKNAVLNHTILLFLLVALFSCQNGQRERSGEYFTISREDLLKFQREGSVGEFSGG